MSQAGLVDIESSHPQIPTSFLTDAGTAIPLTNVLEVLGGEGIATSGAGNTITISGTDATAGASALLATKGISSFDSADFTIVNGFVTLSAAYSGIQSILTDSGLPAIVPDITGQAQFTAGSGMAITGNGPGNLLTIGGVDATTIDLGIVRLASDAQSIAGAITSNYAINPSSLKAKLGTQTDHGIILGTGTATALNTLAPGVTGQLLVSTTFADPSWAVTSYGDFSFSNITAAATPRMLMVVNTDVDAASHADLRLSTPPLGGDAVVSWEVQGSHFFAAGVDNQVAGDPWKLSTSSHPSAGTAAITVDNATAAVTFASAYEFPVADGTTGYPLVTDGAGNLDFSALTIAGGGTGVSSITAHSLIVGDGTNAVNEISVGATGTVLIGNTAADPTFSSTPVVTSVHSTTFDTNVAAAGMTLAGTTIAADGTDANISITMTPKGTGTVNPSALSVNSVYTFPTADGTADQVLTTDGSGAVTWEDNSSTGVLVQEVTANTTSRVTVSTGIPRDNTIPQNTEGVEVLTLAITPTSATNKLIIMFNTFGSQTGIGTPTSALFQDATVNALAANTFGTVSTANYFINGSFIHAMTAGTTSATTFKVRCGGGTLYLNGTSTTGYYNGTASTSLTIREYKP